MAKISTLDLSPDHSFEFWREATRTTYGLGSPKGRRRELRLSATINQISSLVISEFRCQPNHKWRDKKHIAQDGREYVKIRRYHRGGAVYMSNGQMFTLRPGAIYLLDQSRPFAEISEDNYQTNIFAPLELLVPGLSRAQPVIKWQDGSAEGKIIRAAIAKLLIGITLPSFREKLEAEEQFLNVIRGLIEGGPDGFEQTALSDARRKAIEEKLEQAISNPTSRVDEIISSLPYSRATVYRDFARDGGLAEYLRRRRLSCAYDRLCQASEARGSVSLVAGEVGYSSVHSFTRAFRREFGCTPGEIVGTRSIAAEPTSGGTSTRASKFEGAVDVFQAFRHIRAV